MLLRFSKAVCSLGFVLNSPAVLGIVTCGNPEKGYYAEFPNLEFVSQYGLNNITLFRDGNLLDLNRSLFSETAYKLPESEGATATTVNQTYWIYKDGLEATLSFEQEKTYLKLTHPKRKPLKLSCKEQPEANPTDAVASQTVNEDDLLFQ